MAKRKWTNEELKQAVRKSKSISEVLKKLDTTSRATVDKYIKELNISTRHFKRGKPSGIKTDGMANAWWRKFQERLNAYDCTPVESWTHEHILGHVLSLYHNFYGVSFTLSYNRAPSKCYEMYCIKRMMNALGTEDPFMAKQYVEWVFKNIIEAKDTNFKSIAFLYVPDFIYRFKAEYRKMTKVTRSTPLPDDWVSIGIDLGLSVYTYGDLAFAKLALSYDSDSNDNAPYADLFRVLKSKGFDLNVLDNLEK